MTLLPCRGVQLSAEIATSAARPWGADVRPSLVALGYGLLGAIVTFAATGDSGAFTTLWLFERVAGWMR